MKTHLDNTDSANQKLDPIQAVIIQNQKLALEGYKTFLNYNGDFNEYLKKVKEKDDAGWISVTDLPNYEKLMTDMSMRVGLALSELEKIAKDIKAAMREPDYCYEHAWHFCATAAMDHPNMSSMLKYCRDYRQNKDKDKWYYPYEIGEDVNCNVEEGYFIGQITAKHEDEITIQLRKRERGQKKSKFVTLMEDSLHVHPLHDVHERVKFTI